MGVAKAKHLASRYAGARKRDESNTLAATHYAEQHQLIPWRNWHHPPGFGNRVWGHCFFLFQCSAQGQPPFNFFHFGGGREIVIISGWFKLCGTRGEAKGAPSGVDPGRRKGGPRRPTLRTHNYTTPIFPINGMGFTVSPVFHAKEV